MAAPQINSTTSSEIAFSDPLSDETRKTRTHLLFVSALSVLVKAYDLKITKAPWLELDVPANAPEILEGALSAALCYFIFIFVIYGWQDFRRWRLGSEIHHVNLALDLILQSREHLRIIALQLERMGQDSSMEAQVRGAVVEAAVSLPEAQKKIMSLRAGLVRLNWLQWFRVLIIELTLPLMLGGFALFKLSVALGPFLATVIK